METDCFSVPVGGKINFAEERNAYTVQARDGRYLICTKPFPARKTYLYTIVDVIFNVRGADNMTDGRSGGYGERFECEMALAELQDPEHPLDISHRRRIPLVVTRCRAS